MKKIPIQYKTAADRYTYNMYVLGKNIPKKFINVAITEKKFSVGTKITK
jgi:hypothetical protein